MLFRTFTTDELAEIGVPPASPEEVEYGDTVLADEVVATLKYTQQRRCVFIADDDLIYSVTYEAPIDTGDYEVGDGMPDDHGWYGGTVEATRVELVPVTVQRWQPVTADPGVTQ